MLRREQHNLNSCILLLEMQNDAAVLENSQECLKKVNIYLSYSPPITLLDNYPKEMKTCVHTETCQKRFAIALL
jgi:hypothetical protein